MSVLIGISIEALKEADDKEEPKASIYSPTGLQCHKPSLYPASSRESEEKPEASHCKKPRIVTSVYKPQELIVGKAKESLQLEIPSRRPQGPPNLSNLFRRSWSVVWFSKALCCYQSNLLIKETKTLWCWLQTIEATHSDVHAFNLLSKWQLLTCKPLWSLLWPWPWIPLVFTHWSSDPSRRDHIAVLGSNCTNYAYINLLYIWHVQKATYTLGLSFLIEAGTIHIELGMFNKLMMSVNTSIPCIEWVHQLIDFSTNYEQTSAPVHSSSGLHVKLNLHGQHYSSAYCRQGCWVHSRWSDCNWRRIYVGTIYSISWLGF